MPLCTVALIATLLSATVMAGQTAGPQASRDLLNLHPALQVALNAQPSAPAAFDATAAYVPLQGSRLVAVDLETGQVRWSADLEVTQAPAVTSGLVIVATAGALAGLDAATGAERWRVGIAAGLAAPPLADTGWVLASLASGELLALRAIDGHVLWRQPLSAPATARPIAAAHGVYVSLADGNVAALALDTGALRWTRKLGGPPADLLVLDDRLFVGAEDRHFYCLNTENGRIRWSQRIGARPAGAPVVDASRVYYIALDNILYAFDRGGGSRKWHRPLSVRPSGGPLLVGDLVLVPAVAAEVHAYQAETGESAGRAAVDADVLAPPQIIPGIHAAFTRIALVTREGVFTLFARRVEPAPVPMPYPLGRAVDLSQLGP
ncbi:MAG TPA: PQQ-binding-like beta-propeller repeat protein [Vicinamibacterales bacterium]